MVIAPRPLTEFTPLYADSHLNQAITQFDKDDLESIGLVKFDFLGLKTLTIIDNALRMVNQQREAVGEPSLVLDDSMPLDDKATFALMQRGWTTADLPAGIPRHEGADPAPQAGQLRGPDRFGSAVSAGAPAVRHGGGFHQPQARPRAGTLSPPRKSVRSWNRPTA